MTKQEILDLYNGLKAVSNLPGARWAYAVAKNMDRLQPEIRALQKAFAHDEDFAEYESKRRELAKEHAVKEDGKPKTVKVGANEEYLIDDQDKFNKELKKLQKKHEEAVDNREQQIEDFNELLSEEVELDLYMINPDYIPEEITPAQVQAIMAVIDEESEGTTPASMTSLDN